MRRKLSGLRVLRCFWVACLLAPPAARVWLDEFDERRRADSPLPPTAAAPEIVARLREAERDLAALDVTLRRDEYEPVPARVLTEDPSPHRHGLLVGIRSRQRVTADITATTVDHRLLGRVLEVVEPPIDSGGFALAQVQTIFDRAFRVRFVAGERTGLAAGTGETTADGCPLLEIVLLSGSGELENGDLVQTDAAGGVFAPGVPIGSIDTSVQRNRFPVIRSDIVVGRQRQIILLRDVMRLSAARIGWRKS